MKELLKPIVYLKGVGPKRAERFEKLGVKTVYDLLCFYPRSYLDLSSPVTIAEAPPNEQALVRGRVFKKLPPARIRKGMTIYRAAVTDDTADLIVTIYNNEYAFDKLREDGEYLLLGKITGSMLRKEINSPLIFDADTDEKIQPVYHLTEGLTQLTLRNAVRNALAHFDSVIYEPVPDSITKKRGALLVSLCV